MPKPAPGAKSTRSALAAEFSAMSTYLLNLYYMLYNKATCVFVYVPRNHSSRVAWLESGLAVRVCGVCVRRRVRSLQLLIGLQIVSGRALAATASQATMNCCEGEQYISNTCTYLLTYIIIYICIRVYIQRDTYLCICTCTYIYTDIDRDSHRETATTHVGVVYKYLLMFFHSPE